MAYGIVQQHEGLIECYSEPGAGTIFEIYLPAIDGRPKSVEAKIARSTPTKGSETILFVDDEDFVRDLGVRILRRAGYTVIVAGNGREGSEIYEKSGDKIGLVILDLIMPEMGGKQCLEKILGSNPRAKVLIASGAGGLGTTEEAIAAGARGFIRKPFRIDEMLGAVRRILDAD